MNNTIMTPKGLVYSTEETRLDFRIRANVEQEVEVLDAYRLFHPRGDDFWVVALYDEDAGAYTTTWIKGDFSGYVFYETANDPTLGKGAARGAAFGYAYAYSTSGPGNG